MSFDLKNLQLYPLHGLVATRLGLKLLIKWDYNEIHPWLIKYGKCSSFPHQDILIVFVAGQCSVLTIKVYVWNINHKMQVRDVTLIGYNRLMLELP